MSNDLIVCNRLFGGQQCVPRPSLIFRPSIYGIIVHDGMLLVTVDTRTGKCSLPGGGIELGERMEDALMREIREEAGLEADVGGLYDRGESFFYHDPTKEAWHQLFFFFQCTVNGSVLLGSDPIEQTKWVAFSDLQEKDFYSSHSPITRRIIDEHLGV